VASEIEKAARAGSLDSVNTLMAELNEQFELLKHAMMKIA
jgi:hypothetical protein